MTQIRLSLHVHIPLRCHRVPHHRLPRIDHLDAQLDPASTIRSDVEVHND